MYEYIYIHIPCTVYLYRLCCKKTFVKYFFVDSTLQPFIHACQERDISTGHPFIIVYPSVFFWLTNLPWSRTYQSSHQNGKPETPHLPKHLPKRDVGRQLPLGLVVLECFRNLAISNQEVVSPFLPLFEITLLKFRKLKFWKCYHLKYLKFLNHGFWSEPQQTT